AGGVIRLGGEAARPVAVARAGLVTLISRRAGVRGPAAHAAGAHVARRARVPVIARRAVHLVGEAARAVAVARPGQVALVGRGAAVCGPGTDAAGAHIG